MTDFVEPIAIDDDCVCCDADGEVDLFCVNPLADDDNGKDMDMFDDDMMKRGGKGMMRGGKGIMAMLVMDAVMSSVKLFRWSSDSQYDAGSILSSNYWQYANMVSNYGNLTLSVSAILLAVTSQFVDEPMLNKAVGVSIMLGSVVFMIENILRMLAYDGAFTVANDANSTGGDVAKAEQVMSAVKVEMALSVAHEAMAKLAIMNKKGKKGGKGGMWSDSDSDGRRGDKGDWSESDMEKWGDKEDWDGMDKEDWMDNDDDLFI